MKRKSMLTILLLVAVMVLASACSKKPKAGELKLIKETVRLELGEELSDDVADYIMAEDSILEEAELDFEDVDAYEIGTYTAKVIYNEEEYPFTIIVEDTQAPKTALLADVFYLEVNDYLDVDEILEEIEEADDYILTFSYDDEVIEDEGLTFEEAGEYSIIAELIDNSENKTTLKFKVVVSEITIPEFAGLTDMVIRAGQTPDYLAGVTAYDEKDGDLTSKIEVDASDVIYDENGEYEVYYTVLDNDDNEGEAIRKVTVVGNPEYEDDDDYEEPEEPEDMTIPEIHGVQDFTIQVNGQLPDFRAGITAFDEKDGDLTARIEIDASDIDVTEEGEYQVYYSVVDNDDNEGMAISIVTIVE